MTICVSVKVSEGLVLAADSTATLQGSLKDPKGNVVSGVLKTYDHAQKLSHLKDYPIGTLTWGLSQIGPRTVASLIKEYEYSLPSLEEENEKRREQRMGGVTVQPYAYQMKNIAQGLFDHVKKYYETEFAAIPSGQRPPLGVLVSGFSSDNFYPDQWELNFPHATELKELRPDVNGRPAFGANWFGMTDAIIRLHWGRDDQLIDDLSEKFEKTKEEVRSVIDAHQYPVAFDGMPLQDAIDYAVFLVNVVIGRFRFVVGAPLCGGDIDVAVITPASLTWIRRKSWRA